MTTVPSNLVPTRISQLTEYTGDSTDGYLPYVLNGITYKVQFSQIAAVGAVPSTRTITGADGLTGGGDLSENRVISLLDGGVTFSKLADSGVVAGSYGSASTIPVLDIDAKGRVTVATTVAIDLGGYVPTSRSIIAGDGLSGGGTLAANRTISLALTAEEPKPLGVAVAGESTFAARDDHVHPAVNLTDTTETSGVLPMSRGGTGSSLSPAAGAILYSTGSQTALSNGGDVGQIFVSGGPSGAPDWYDISGGVTGLSFSVVGGSYVLGGTVAVVAGGTGATTVEAARVNLLPSYTGNAGKALTVNPGATDVEWTTVTGLGTVTSVDVSGGTTGLTTSGGPITAAGTITLGGILGPLNGGTGIGGYATGDLIFANSSSTLDRLTSGTGVLVASGGAPSYTSSPSLTQVTVAADPTLALQVATKQYVDTVATTSVHYHTPVKYEVPDTTGNLNATYNNGTAGVGATLTNAGTQTAFTPDGVVASVGDRILVYNQTNAAQNGVYTVTTVGSGSTNWVLTRATDADTYDPISPNSLGGGDAFFVTSGNTGAGETYVCNNVGPIVFGTTAISFVQVSSAPAYSAGTGLTLVGNQFSLSTPVSIALGGTGQTTAAAAFNALSPIASTGDLIVGNGTNSATRLAIGANGYILTSDGTTASWGPAPSSMVYPGAGIAVSTGSAWGTSYSVSGTGDVALTNSPTFVTPNLGTPSAATLTNATGLPLSTGVTGTLPVANGGTGATTLTANNVLLGNGTSALQTVAPGASGNVLVSDGTTWVSQAPAPSGISQAKVTGLNFIFGL